MCLRSQEFPHPETLVSLIGYNALVTPGLMLCPLTLSGSLSGVIIAVVLERCHIALITLRLTILFLCLERQVLRLPCPASCRHVGITRTSVSVCFVEPDSCLEAFAQEATSRKGSLCAGPQRVWTGRLGDCRHGAQCRCVRICVRIQLPASRADLAPHGFNLAGGERSCLPQVSQHKQKC